jgi:hypothetical protein
VISSSILKQFDLSKMLEKPQVKLKTLEMKLKDLKHSKSPEREKDVKFINGIDAFRNVLFEEEEEFYGKQT